MRQIVHNLTCALALILGLVAITSQAHAIEDTLVVVTSYPPDTTETIKAAFKKVYPGIQVEMLKKKTTAGIKYLQETAGNNQSDLFWASAPDAFEVLKDDGLLAKYQVKIKGRLLQGFRRLGLRDHVEYPVFESQEAAGAGRMGRSQESGLQRPCGHECAVALGDHASHRRDPAPGRRLGQGLGADEGDRR